MRIAVYTGYAYNRGREGRIFATRAFALFLVRLADRLDTLTLIGGVRPQGREGEEAQYSIPPEITLVELPYHESLAHPASVISPSAFRRFWRALDQVEAVWIFGPHPIAIAFTALAFVRGRRVVLGVRQDTVAYMRARHPRRRALHAGTRLLEAAFRLLSRRFPTIVVGPALARRYAGASRLLEIAVSLVEASDIISPDVALARRYDRELQILSVGRLEAEKNPLVLADVLATLNREGGRWRLIVCGEGEMREQLADRLGEVGEADRARILGYVTFGEELTTLYRSSHALLHNSLTEGLPQVLLEAMAAGIPVVVSDVGGIRDAVGESVLLVPAGDARAAASALRAVASDSSLRRRLVTSGYEFVCRRTIDAETEKVSAFLGST